MAGHRGRKRVPVAHPQVAKFAIQPSFPLLRLISAYYAEGCMAIFMRDRISTVAHPQLGAATDRPLPDTRDKSLPG